MQYSFAFLLFISKIFSYHAGSCCVLVLRCVMFSLLLAVANYPFDDRNAPPFELIKPFCQDMEIWLKADERNVAVVHCTSGKVRWRKKMKRRRGREGEDRMERKGRTGREGEEGKERKRRRGREGRAGRASLKMKL